MRFENQVSLYDTDAIINKFTTQDTKINVVQGEIDLIVSEAEREELAGGTSTMYSQFADVKLDVEGLTASFSFLEGEFDTLSGQYSSLDSRLTTYKATVDGLSVNVSNIQTNLTENYSTTEDVHAYADGVGRNAISTAASDATTKANNALQSANDNTASLLRSYSTTTEMNSAISASAESIEASVSRTYATTAYVDSSAATYRNLILNSAFIMGLEHWNNYNASYPPAVKEVSIIDGVRYLHLRLNSVFTGISQSRSKDGVYLKPGGKYTIQFRAYRSSSGASQVKLTYYLGSLNNRVVDTITIGTNPTTYRVVATVRTNLDRYDYFGIGISGDSSTATDIYLSAFIVREGSFSDDIVWAPAPEDGTTDVAELNAWKSEAELKITDSAIISTVINSDEFSSAIIQEADSIRLQASNISWQSDYSSMTADGILTCTNANISGTLNSTTINGGYISGVEIWGSSFANGNFFFEDKIYNNVNHQSIDDGVGGLLICDDGISCVGDFGECRIEADGCMTVFQENSSLSEATNSVASPHITDGVRVYGANGKYASKLTYGALCVGMDESASLINPVFWVDQQYLSCSGSKDRIVTTDSYGTRALVCYEMPSPMFGDIGTGTTDESGVCYIDFNPIWCETVDLDGEYYVFLQEEGEGKLYVTEKTALGFCVKGTPGLRFSWEVKAYQFDGRGKYMVDAGTRMMESEAGA